MLQDKIALVTGGTQGIGKAIAEKLLVGATVAIAALNDDTLQYASEKFKPYGVDLSQESGCGK